MDTRTLFAASVLSLTLAFCASANPIAMPNGSYINEDLHITIIPDGNSLQASVTSEFALYPKTYSVTSILFPVPRDTHDVSVYQVVGTTETPVAWYWAGPWYNYTTIVPEEPNVPMIEWDGTWAVNTVPHFKVVYHHTLIDRPMEKVFFYASGVSKLSGTTQFFNVDFDVTLPPCYSVSSLVENTTPWPYTQTGYVMNFLIHPGDSGIGSSGFRIYTDTILSLKYDVAACDCAQNGIPDYEELSYTMTFFAPRTGGRAPAITQADYEGDFDGDGDTDKVVCTTSTATVMLNDGSGNFAAVQTLPAHDLAHAKVFDIDNDGDVDIMLAMTFKDSDGEEYPAVSIYLNDGKSHFRPGQILKVTSAPFYAPLQVNCVQSTYTDVTIWYNFGSTLATTFRINKLTAPSALDINANSVPDSCENLLPGDLNYDGVYDANDDSAAFAMQWLRTGCMIPTWCLGTDSDHNGLVDFLDFALFATAWVHEQ
jgi:hypothetical protein